MRSLVVVSILCGAGAAYADEPLPADPASPAPAEPAPTDPANPAPVTEPAPTEPAAVAPPAVAPAVEPAPAPAPVATVDPTTSPGFVTMLRQDANSRLGADATYVFVDTDADVTLLRFDIHGQWIAPGSRAGVYAQVPIAFLSDGDNSETALGGVEIGGIYIPKMSAPNFGLVLRGGLTLPTVSDGDGALVGLIASYMRPIDIYGQIPESATIRLAASPMLRSGNVFIRLDAGLDINVYNADDDDIDPGLMINLGGGVDLGNVALMGELTTMAITGDGGDSITTAAFSVRGNAGTVQPYGALVLPLEDQVREDFNAGLLLGIEGKL